MTRHGSASFVSVTRLVALVALVALGTLGAFGSVAPASAGTVEGRIFLDANGNGLEDAGEEGVDGVAMTIWWGTDMRFTGASGADGTFSVVADRQTHQVAIDVPEGFRLSFPDQTWDPTVEGPDDDVVHPRWGTAPNLIGNVDEPTDIDFLSLGDSIPDAFNLCGDDTDYIPDVVADLGFITQEGLFWENRAISGSMSEDLLTPELAAGGANPQYLPNAIEIEREVVTLTIGGNDYLATQGDLAANLQELVTTRASMQEALSFLVTELPRADVIVTTVYDNEAVACDTSDFHARTTPLWSQVTRRLAFGQARHVGIAEVALDFAHQDVTRTRCGGATGRVCTAPLDQVHPNAAGAGIIQRAIMEAIGEVDVPETGTIDGVRIGLQRRVAVLPPTRVTASELDVSDARNALVLDGAAAVVRPSSDGASVLRVGGFELPSGVEPANLVVGVRYRTSAPFADDTHRFEASVVGFTAPEWTVTGWDTVSPIVGGSGTQGSAGVAGPSRVNLLSDVPEWREVTAHVSLNAIDDGTATGLYQWPAPTADDVAALEVRLTVEMAGAGPDAAALEWDGAWLEVYGVGEPAGAALGEVSDVRAGEDPLTVASDGASLILTWDVEPDADAYRVYRGVLPAVAGAPDPFAQALVDPAAGVGGCSTDTSFSESLPAGDVFYLVAATAVGSPRGPVGSDSAGVPRSTGPASCP